MDKRYIVIHIILSLPGNHLNMKYLRVVFIVLLISALTGCKKESNTIWTYCQSCGADNWVGNYTGVGDYYNGTSDKQYLDVESNLDIVNVSGTVLKIAIVVPDHYQSSFTVSKEDNDYFISVPGSSSSVLINLTQSGEKKRITGTVKSYHYKADSLIVDHSISFEVFD